MAEARRGRAGTATKPAVKKTTAKKATATKATAKKATAKKATAKKATAQQATVKKATVKKAPATAKKATAATKAPARKAPTKAPATKAAATKTPTKTPATKAAAKKTPARKTTARGRGPALPVREGEAPWTAAEVTALRTEIEGEVTRLRQEVEEAEVAIAELLRDSGDGGGDDQVDTGSKAFEREHEMALANTNRDALAQNEHALKRLEDGTYGTCDRCGNAIGKRRLQAFPRAILCLSCKQLEERH